MKTTSLALPVTAAALAVASVFAVATPAQTPPQGAPHAPRTYPAPVNLKVLPKDLTGKQVRDIMEGWEEDLGTHCDTCHTADPNNIGPNGRPRLKFDDDSKPEKEMARIMYKMTEEIKAGPVKKVADMDKMGSPAAPLTCGTCHRGHLDPEAFVPPPHEGHDHAMQH